MKTTSIVLLLAGVSVTVRLAAVEFDLVIYGGTAGAVTAAVQAKKMGRSAVIVCPDQHLGGLSSGGLGWTDSGNKAVVGGLSREFYQRVWQHYAQPDAWRWQTPDEFIESRGGRGKSDDDRTMWNFEPHVAETVFEDFIRDYQIPVHRNEWLDRATGVKKTAARIVAITMLSGKTFAGKMFIDATYEGDLMAAAGIDYHIGRESRAQYGEEFNGVQTGVLHHRHHFGVLPVKISPYKVPGDPQSGVLPRINVAHPGEFGAADHKVQAYCYRMCLTNHPENRVPFPKPAGYDPAQYELLLRIYAAGWRDTFGKFDPVPNRKTDTNNHGPFSTDNLGMNYDYPDATYERRRAIIQEHTTYQQGWLYFSAHDPRVPAEVRQEMNRWGLARDEFKDNGHWPHQLYIREARRMAGKFVMTENELLKRRATPESVGMGSYSMDSHNVQRYITPEGDVQNEGDIGVSTRGPYGIAYGSLVPKPGQADNLLVPVCVSSSHIAYGSIRMEPVFMVLGQSAATAAVLAIEAKERVQDVPYARLRARLIADGQVLEFNDPNAIRDVDTRDLPGVVVDDSNATVMGNWMHSGAGKRYVGRGYRHDGNARNGGASARFTAQLPNAGRYEVRSATPFNNNRASNTRVAVHHAGGVHVTTINQKTVPPIGELWTSVGTFEFPAGDAAVVISNPGTDGYVVIDAVQWLPQ